jgi:hypothetical protein
MLDQCRPETILVASMPSAPAKSRHGSTDSGVVIKDETPEDKLKKPSMPSEMREWTFASGKTKARIVELTSADSERRSPLKLVEKDFDKRGRYQVPKKMRVVFDYAVDLADITLRIAAFFRDESCGQCVPCRVGTVRQEEALARVMAGNPRGSLGEELALIDEIGQVMRDDSICGLGQLAANAVDSAIHRLKLFEGGAA